MGEQQGFWAYGRSTIRYINWAYQSQSGKYNSVTVAAPSDNQENDLLLAYLIYESGDGISAPTTVPTCSGWTNVQRQYYGKLCAAVLYKWCAASEASSYTFTHTETEYGAMGGSILRFRDSIMVSHSPIRRTSPISGSPIYAADAYYGNADFGWNTDPLGADYAGAIVLSLGAIRRVPSGATVLYMYTNNVTGYTDISGLIYIGGQYDGNNVGGGIGYQKFNNIGQALDGGYGDPPSIATGGGGIAGEVGPSSGQTWLFGQLMMLI